MSAVEMKISCTCRGTSLLVQLAVADDLKELFNQHHFVWVNQFTFLHNLLC